MYLYRREKKFDVVYNRFDRLPESMGQTELLYQYLMSDNDARKKLPATFLSVHPVCTLTKINMSY